MKKERFIQIFEQNLTHTLATHPENKVLSPAIPSCVAALKTALVGVTEVTPENRQDIQNKFFPALDVLVNRQSIRGKAAHHSKSTFGAIRLETPAVVMGANATVQPVIMTRPSVSASTAENKAISDDTQFKPNDLNYEVGGYSAEDKRYLAWAENCCAYPKLALALKNVCGPREINDYLGEKGATATNLPLLTPRMLKDYCESRKKLSSGMKGS